MRQSAKDKEQQEAIARLKEWLKPGDTVYTILRHVSRSGMQREISLRFFGDKREAAYDLDYTVAQALGRRIGRHGGIIIGGCGMDMGFALVYDLSSALWPSGYGCVGEKCKSNDHANGDRDYTPHYDGVPRNTEEVGKDLKAHQHWHNEGGYALSQRWL